MLQVLEKVSKTYIDIAEKITGQKLIIPNDPENEIVKILDSEYGVICDKKMRVWNAIV